MSEELSRRLDRGEWSSDPWFLRPSKTFDEALFSLAQRLRAANALARLYPPVWCADARGTPQFGLVAGLFASAWPLAISPLLQVGIDLDDAGAFCDDSLIGRLRSANEFPEAAFELRVRASLARNGYQVSKVEESDSSTPDLVVRKDGFVREVEVKYPNQSSLDSFVDRIASPALMNGVPEANGFVLKLHGSTALHAKALHPDGLRALERDLPNMVAAFREVALAIGSEPHTGTFDVEGYGYIQVEPANRGISEISPLIFPEQDDAKRARRVCSLMTKSLRKRQFSGKAPGIFVVGVFRRAKLSMVEDELWAWASKDGRSLQPTHMVVLVDNFKSAPYRFTQIAYPFCTRRKRSLTKADLRFAAAAAGWCMGNAELFGRARRGDPWLELSTQRRNVSSVKIAGTKCSGLPSSVALRFDGSQPDIVPVAPAASSDDD